jgi:methylated-DNA-[protein]-cysteine S-methyltransferase
MRRAEKEQNWVKYTVFRTKWGYFGLAGTDSSLWRTCLPVPQPDTAQSILLHNLQPVASCVPTSDKALFKALQGLIVAYFEGTPVEFSPATPVILNGLGDFTRSVLTACHRIGFGQVVSYRELARHLGRPKAVRAVGNALAANPMPLIIPCHRVIRDDSSLGGFSAPGGITLKERLLRHEGYQPR